MQLLSNFIALCGYSCLIFISVFVLQRLDVAEFSGLRSNSCVTYASGARDASFLDVVAAQLTPKVNCSSYYRIFAHPSADGVINIYTLILL